MADPTMRMESAPAASRIDVPPLESSIAAAKRSTAPSLHRESESIFPLFRTLRMSFWKRYSSSLVSLPEAMPPTLDPSAPLSLSSMSDSASSHVASRNLPSSFMRGVVSLFGLFMKSNPNRPRAQRVSLLTPVSSFETTLRTSPSRACTVIWHPVPQ